MDFDEQLAEWTATIADTRLQGTTHERPIDRFAREREHPIATAAQPSFKLQARGTRRLAEDSLVSFETNRYSVPFTLIGQSVEVERQGEPLRIYHHGQVIASHTLLAAKRQCVILPEHGPGPIARNARRRYRAPSPVSSQPPARPEVEVRDLSVYEQLTANCAQEVIS